MAVEMVPVSSTNVSAVGYDPETREMTVEFQSGNVYVYSGVPAEVPEELKASASPGSYFYRNVRNQYRFRKES